MTVALYILVWFKSQIKIVYKVEATVTTFQNYGTMILFSTLLIPVATRAPQ